MNKNSDTLAAVVNLTATKSAMNSSEKSAADRARPSVRRCERSRRQIAAKPMRTIEPIAERSADWVTGPKSASATLAAT